MAEHVQALAPEEACGLVAGTAGVAASVYPVTNLLHSARRYRMAPAEQLAAMLEIEARGWQLLAIYHSHPQGPAQPSQTDLAEAAYPAALQLIWSRQAAGWDCRAFSIQSGALVEVPVSRQVREQLC
jgi:proteasome lid subunit RPN8/RPN11